VRGNLLPLHEIALADKVSLAMTEERCHFEPFTYCHSDPERSEGEESHSAQDRLLKQSQGIATPSVHNDQEAILSIPASSPEGHSTNFYCKTVPIGDSHRPG